jgi:hypothetical protein
MVQIIQRSNKRNTKCKRIMVAYIFSEEPKEMYVRTVEGINIDKTVDLSLQLHQDLWTQYPDSGEVGEQVFLTAVAIWNTKVMAESSRKLFNGAKDEIWARLAAWAEWANVSPSSLSACTSS